MIRSASTTIASTVSLSRPRAPESATTAAVIVGENDTTMTTSICSMTSRWRPTASGAIGSQGHTSHPRTAMPTSATASVATVIRAMAASRAPSRSTLSVKPAMRAISVVARPVTTCSSAAIDSVIRLAR